MIWQNVYSISFVKSAILCVIRYILLCICTLYILEILRNVCLGMCISIIVPIYISYNSEYIVYVCVFFLMYYCKDIHNFIYLCDNRTNNMLFGKTTQENPGSQRHL